MLYVSKAIILLTFLMCRFRFRGADTLRLEVHPANNYLHGMTSLLASLEATAHHQSCPKV